MTGLLRASAWILFGCGVIVAQQTARLSFETASIQPAAPVQPSSIVRGIQDGPATPGQMSWRNLSLSDLIAEAWEVKSYQVSGPGWLRKARFDVEAKLPPGTTKAQSRLMLQNLLAERFRLALHRSTKETPIYALLVAKNGPKLRESASNPNPAVANGGAAMTMIPDGRVRVAGNGATIGNLIDVLIDQLDRPVLDMTGLTGSYGFTLDFTQTRGLSESTRVEDAPPGFSGGATIFAALPDQLGLRLEPRKAPIDLLVIDSALKTPTEK